MAHLQMRGREARVQLQAMESEAKALASKKQQAAQEVERRKASIQASYERNVLGEFPAF